MACLGHYRASIIQYLNTDIVCLAFQGYSQHFHDEDSFLQRLLGDVI